MGRALANGIVAAGSLLALALTIFTGGDGERAGITCTAKGCSSGIMVETGDLPYAPENVATVKVCAAGHCMKTTRESDLVDIPLSSGGPHTVRVTAALFDTAGRALASDEQVVERARVYPNGRCCGGACLFAATALSPEGQLGTRPRFGRLPSRRGGPRADLVGSGRVSRASAAAPTGDLLEVVPREQVEIRADARRRVRVTARGGRVDDDEPFRLDDRGRVWLIDVPDQLSDSGAELVVRLDCRRDRRTAEFHFPIQPVSGP